MSHSQEFTHITNMLRFNFWARPFFPPQHLIQDGENENPTYFPNPISSQQAMMVLASAASENNREDPQTPTPRPAHTQEKDLPGSISSYPMFRQTFLPTKRSKMENGPSHSLQFSPDSQKESIEPTSTSITIKDEQSLTPTSVSYEIASDIISESGESQDRNSPDDGSRSLRKQRKRTTDNGLPCCPVCGITLRPGEIQAHFSIELEKVEKLSRYGRRAASREGTPLGHKGSPLMFKGKSMPSGENATHCRYDTYLRVKNNRQNRLSAKSKYNKKKKIEETVCPICNETVKGTPEELNEHAEQCLKKREEGDEMVDIEGDGMEFEEYTWAGQTRIRATSMVEGGFKGLGFQTSSKKDEDEDLNLDVDGDDCDMFGRAQYSEKDIIPCNLDEPDEEKSRKLLRGAYLKSEINAVSSEPSDRNRWILNGGEGCSENTEYLNNNDKDRSLAEPSTCTTEIVESLKGKIRDMETDIKVRDKFKCLICMEPYRIPLVSIQCWHTHCEECWLRTLGSKKLCPQCNMITAASDLRKVYL